MSQYTFDTIRLAGPHPEDHKGALRRPPKLDLATCTHTTVFDADSNTFDSAICAGEDIDIPMCESPITSGSGDSGIFKGKEGLVWMKGSSAGLPQEEKASSRESSVLLGKAPGRVDVQKEQPSMPKTEAAKGGQRVEEAGRFILVRVFRRIGMRSPGSVRR
ncbi:uncharacterized protein LAESUDRAFT_816207 [Laetiporus sulphureus 93-53]|uniref:Uncharacterized protein n=1 Tax=Laetiporus sulphureus 93-53 TaxID=1314785 RepID=A0A165BFE3_9APHY|nr:uncharacterized protein LAESUDRAFT_816207 [Laetiporus sulphureus 93-53]KZT00939.1 hypothetical protein LAESUDRAFT_816207 [Laetiporus sulphureus 93-53]